MADSTQGKVLILPYQDKILTILTQGNRFVSVSASDKTGSSLVGNIYMGKVKNIVPGIQAAFVEIGKGELGYLSLTELKMPLFGAARTGNPRLREGDEVLVQVVRDAQKTKPHTLTTDISIAGQYLVISLEPRESLKAGKVSFSGKLSSSEKKKILGALCVAGKADKNGGFLVDEELQKEITYGMVIRTNAKALEECDYEPLLKEWEQLTGEVRRLLEIYAYRPAYTCFRSQRAQYLTCLQGIYRDAYDEIVTDCSEIRETIQTHLELPVRLYQDPMISLEKLYSVERKIQEALQPRIWLKSGGYLIIEPTEALTVIDVNSGKYEGRRGTAEETYLQTNLEAAREIAWQLRLRNISGIIVIDFISMQNPGYEQQLLQELKQAVRQDPIQTNVIDITALGLVEITRKKINKPLQEQLRTE